MPVYRIKKPTIKIGAMVRVPKWLVNMQRVHDELNIRNGAFWMAVQAGVNVDEVKDRIQLYSTDDVYAYFPRHYRIPWKSIKGKKRIGEAKLEHFNAKCNEWDDRGYSAWRTTIILRDEIQRDASLALCKEGDKLLALSCGKGKTVISLDAAASNMNRFPVLVIVNTNALLTQWRREIMKFYKMPERRVGHIQQDKEHWEGCPIAVAMLHTVVKRKYKPAFYKNWNTIIFDEAHRLGTEYFVKACSLFPGERWGLSATLKRDDGMDKLIRLHMGEVAYENLSQPLKPKVYFIKTGLRVNERLYQFRRGKTNLGRMSTEIAMNEPRNKQIQFWIERAANKGRRVLVLGERLAQLNDLYQTSHIVSKSLHVGSMNAEDRERALRSQVVFATQHLAKEGLDVPALDTLFILQPFGGEGRLRQSVGRILREYPNKQKPQVIVMEDDIGIMSALCNKMRRHLRRLEWSYKVVNKRGNDEVGQSGSRGLSHKKRAHRVVRSKVRKAANRNPHQLSLRVVR